MNGRIGAFVVATFSLTLLGACGSLDGEAATRKPSATPTPHGHTMSAGEHTPIPANSSPLSAAQLQRTSRKAVLLLQGELSDGSSVRGTAFVHDIDGQIAITAAHVVEGAQDLKAVFFDGTEQPVDVVGANDCSDLAVVRVGGHLPKDSVRLPLGNSDALAPGDAVTAVGYPDKRQARAARAVPTPGIVQDLNVSVNTDPSLPELVGAIQHDATLEPGSSGGPLLDVKGNVVGINSLSGSADTRGPYYSIPINTAHHETDLLLTGENVNSLGWRLSAHVANRASTAVERALRKAGYRGGMFVESIEAGSPVDGRVQVGDLVAKLNNTPVNTRQDVCEVLEQASPGGPVSAEGIRVFSSPRYERFRVQWPSPQSN